MYLKIGNVNAKNIDLIGDCLAVAGLMGCDEAVNLTTHIVDLERYELDKSGKIELIDMINALVSNGFKVEFVKTLNLLV